MFGRNLSGSEASERPDPIAGQQQAIRWIKVKFGTLKTLILPAVESNLLSLDRAILHSLISNPFDDTYNIQRNNESCGIG